MSSSHRERPRHGSMDRSRGGEVLIIDAMNQLILVLESELTQIKVALRHVPLRERARLIAARRHVMSSRVACGVL